MVVLVLVVVVGCDSKKEVVMILGIDLINLDIMVV